ncbi:hypothetical protein FRC14_003117 [Serendipita sp. 396]|nr:hypothetical protein FRC14_003117 [Serendipita sp. 396]KAG8788100.1 hypothetical protein FRC15_006064 [Serendipita sp. 397]KAG8874785.1 hypothetical protein FRC20_005213 [Serendipita sp. 405]KAG9056019.1 hypothetical protein FS842_000516 [Serendipita sp. 407]
MMENWSKLSAGLAGLNIGGSAANIGKTLTSSYQAARERLGQIPAEDITELPQEYRDLESRVDALRQAHLTLQRIARVYETETYDYPVQVQQSIAELSTNVAHNVTSFAAANLKDTSIPAPSVTPAAKPLPKTLPHAISRAALAGASSLGPDIRLGKALDLYGNAMEKVGQARLDQDDVIVERFLQPWNVTVTSSIAVAMQARTAVRASRLHLDSAKQTLKAAAPAKQEQARLEVENAEDDLVQKTEVAITLMKTVLDNPEPLKNINELIKAQLVYFAAAAEALSAVQGEVEELSLAAEGEYRKSRDH